MEGCSDQHWQADSENNSKLEILPAELLVYIVSLLPTVRDKLKLRYVSRRLRAVTETPSLWREIYFPLYDHREELSLINFFKACGEYIKQLIFPHAVTPAKLINMIRLCGNATHISLPARTKLNPVELRKALQQMPYLKRLSVQIRGNNIEPLLMDSLEELTVYISPLEDFALLPWIQQWVNKGFVPSNLSLVSLNDIPYSVYSSLVSQWPQWNAHLPAKYKAYFRLYDNYKIPLNVSYKFPLFHLQFGQKASLPFIKASQLGVLGFSDDLLQVTNYNVDDKVVSQISFRCLTYVDSNLNNHEPR